MELIDRVKEAKKVLADAQKDLLLWCRDKNTPLKERWNVWEMYVDKNDRSCISTGSPILNDLMCWYLDRGYVDRHSTVDYECLIEYLCESWEEGVRYENKKGDENITNIINRHVVELRDRKIESVLSGTNTNGVVITTPTTADELEIFLKEEVIKANFGSTTNDW